MADTSTHRPKVREAVALVNRSGKSIGQVAKELDLTETSLRNWVRKAEVGGVRSRYDRCA